MDYFQKVTYNMKQAIHELPDEDKKYLPEFKPNENPGYYMDQNSRHNKIFKFIKHQQLILLLNNKDDKQLYIYQMILYIIDFFHYIFFLKKWLLFHLYKWNIMLLIFLYYHKWGLIYEYHQNSYDLSHHLIQQQ